MSNIEKTEWLKQMTAQQFDHIFGPPTVFEPDGRYLDLNGALYGGVINKPEDAIDYANVLIHLNPGLSLIPKRALQAEEKDGAWHISAEAPGHHTMEVLQFSRYDARLLSGKL